LHNVLSDPRGWPLWQARMMRTLCRDAVLAVAYWLARVASGPPCCDCACGDCLGNGHTHTAPIYGPQLYEAIYGPGWYLMAGAERVRGTEGLVG